jgi:hypothetical protein
MAEFSKSLAPVTITIGKYVMEQLPSGNTNTITTFGYLSDGNIDKTEGIGAFSDIILLPGSHNLDIGGGAWDHITQYIKQKFQAINHVLDPFQRSNSHNAAVLKFGMDNGGFDSVTSMSVLNVISNRSARIQHLELAYSQLKNGGFIYIKVYEGNKSNQPNLMNNDHFQMNCKAEFYLSEVVQVFGKDNVFAEFEKCLIVGLKRVNN